MTFRPRTTTTGAVSGRTLSPRRRRGYDVPKTGETSMLVLFFALVHAPCLSPEDRALAYLIREVPAWNVEHKCFSCHNNGDGARTLYTAIRLKRAVPDEALTNSTRWLERPEDWVYDADDKSHSDLRLDRIQFGTALLEAMDAGHIKERKPLLKAAELIAAQQHRDGYWPVG